MLKQIEHRYLVTLARELRKAGVTRRVALHKLRSKVGLISSRAATRCAVNEVFRQADPQSAAFL